MRNRRTLHALVDELPEPEIPAARWYLEYLRQTADPLRPALESAPADDEILTDDDLAAIRQGRRERAKGETTSHDEIKRLLSETE